MGKELQTAFLVGKADGEGCQMRLKRAVVKLELKVEAVDPANALTSDQLTKALDTLFNTARGIEGVVKIDGEWSWEVLGS